MGVPQSPTAPAACRPGFRLPPPPASSPAQSHRSPRKTARTRLAATWTSHADGATRWKPRLLLTPPTPIICFPPTSLYGTDGGVSGAYSTDGGRTWTARQIGPLDGLPLSRCDPQATFDRFG